MTKRAILSASILGADFSQLGVDINSALDAGMDAIHFDVMDHHFVPNLSIGAMVCASLRQSGIKAPIDVHLMVESPELYLAPFAKAGANLITFHPETCKNPEAFIDEIHEAGLDAGLAFNPDQAVDISDALLEKLEMVLLMSVYPGFGGQSFIPKTLDKIKEARTRIDHLGCRARLAVDGGVKPDNLLEIRTAGADFFVIGSALFKARNYACCVSGMRASLEK